MKQTTVFFCLLIFCAVSLSGQIQLVHPKYLQGETYALVVGISDYVDDELDLTVADQDADAIAQWLRSEGFPPLDENHLLLLKNHAASRQNILLALQTLAVAASEKDRIILYFSCHGAPQGLAAADFQTANGANLVFHSEIKSILKSSLCTQTLMIVDACHAGGGEDASYLGIVTDLVKGYKNSGISMLLSSNINQSSLEYPSAGLSYFTHYFLEGVMQGYANRNGDNLITIQEAFDYVHLNVDVMTEGKQTPVMGGDIDPYIVMRLY